MTYYLKSANIKTNAITEYTGDAGTSIEGVNFKDIGDINIATGNTYNFQINATPVTEFVTTGIKVNQIDELTATSGVTIDSVILKDGQVTVTGDPTLDMQVATKQYIDNLIDGLSWITAAKAASNGNIVIATGGLAPANLDAGVTLVENDRVLLWLQTDPIENGVYIVHELSAWIRSADTNGNDEFANKSIVVQQGTNYGDVEFTCTNDAITVGTTEITVIRRTSTHRHRNLSDLQGGTTDQYYHLTSTQHTLLTGEVSDFFGAVTAASNGDLNLGSGDLTCVDIASTGTMTINTINEKTAGLGVTIEGMKVENNTDSGNIMQINIPTGYSYAFQINDVTVFEIGT